jgi:hypothetical protein
MCLRCDEQAVLGKSKVKVLTGDMTLAKMLAQEVSLPTLYMYYTLSLYACLHCVVVVLCFVSALQNYNELCSSDQHLIRRCSLAQTSTANGLCIAYYFLHDTLNV